MMVMSCGMW